MTVQYMYDEQRVLGETVGKSWAYSRRIRRVNLSSGNVSFWK